MSFKTLIATSALALSLATAAIAEGNFTGFYAGANLGYGTGKVDFNNNLAAPASTKADLSVSGMIGGLHGGYQYQIESFVLGAEAALSLSNTEGSVTTSAIKSALKRKNSFILAGRLGYVMNSNLLPYVKLGWDNASFEQKTTGSVTAANNISKSKRINGFVAGLGLDALVGQNFMVGGEWSYTFYSKTTLVGGATNNSSTPRIADFKVRLGYKF